MIKDARHVVHKLIVSIVSIVSILNEMSVLSQSTPILHTNKFKHLFTK